MRKKSPPDLGATPRLDRRRRCCRFASHTMPRGPPRHACGHTKTERRARDARDKTRARPNPLQPCGAQKHPSPQKCGRLSPTRSVHLSALVLLHKDADDDLQQQLACALDITTTRVLSHIQLHLLFPLVRPSIFEYSDSAQCSRSSRLISAPCQPRDCAEFVQVRSRVSKLTSKRPRPGRCEAGARTGGRKLEGSKRETDRNGSAYPALLVEYDGVLAFFPRVVSFEFR